MSRQVQVAKQKNTRVARRLLWAAGIINVLMLFASCSLLAMANSSNAEGGDGISTVGIVGLMLLPLGFGVFALFYASSQGLWFEMGKQRVWRRVCAGLGGSFVGEGFDVRASARGVVKDSFGNVFGEGWHNSGPQKKKIYPGLRDVYGSHEGWTGLVEFLHGQKLEEYTKHAQAFAMSFRVPVVTFDMHDSGFIRIRAGKVPVPAAYDYPARGSGSKAGVRMGEVLPMPDIKDYPKVHYIVWPFFYRIETWFDAWDRYKASGGVSSVPARDARVLARRYGKEVESVKSSKPVIKPVHADGQPAALLQAVPMARSIEGKVWHMPIEGKHVLIAARSGGGKGSWVWSLVLRLEPAWRAGLVRFWGCDPKRLELSLGREWWTHYANKDVGMVELLEEAVSEMYRVGDELEGEARCFTVSRETPLNIVVIDELAHLSSLLGDKKLQLRADNAIRQLLNQGRSNSFSVVACVQDPRKSVVDFRDSFHIRIAGGLDNVDMVDLVLGKGMHEAGAACEQIPIGKEGAGVAYVLDAEQAMKPLQVRAAWVSDATIRNALAPNVRANAEAYEAQDE